MDTILSKTPISGGSINRCWKVQTDTGWYFLKENSAEKFPGMFEAEGKGLQLLSSSGTFHIPKIIDHGEKDGAAFLLMEFIDRGNEHNWYSAGACLAKLHRNTNENFGLDHNNYIGSLSQSNTFHSTWSEFFTLERILPQIKVARDNGAVDRTLAASAEKFCAKLDEIFPMEKAALLHGDLWSGNFFFGNKGPCVFDPAVYYGHREMDLAMTKLFGGFDDDFYSGYENEFPLEKKWRSRVDLCNLYPLLVHVNLFGGGYVSDVRSVLRQF